MKKGGAPPLSLREITSGITTDCNRSPRQKGPFSDLVQTYYLWKETSFVCTNVDESGPVFGAVGVSSAGFLRCPPPGPVVPSGVAPVPGHRVFPGLGVWSWGAALVGPEKAGPPSPAWSRALAGVSGVAYRLWEMLCWSRRGSRAPAAEVGRGSPFLEKGTEKHPYSRKRLWIRSQTMAV